MEAYTSFASIYDLFMDNVPYDEWCGQLVKILSEHGIRDGIVAELGCGTGCLTERLARDYRALIPAWQLLRDCVREATDLAPSPIKKNVPEFD